MRAVTHAQRAEQSRVLLSVVPDLLVMSSTFPNHALLECDLYQALPHSQPISVHEHD